jgi:hypothetical protein
VLLLYQLHAVFVCYIMASTNCDGPQLTSSVSIIRSSFTRDCGDESGGLFWNVAFALSLANPVNIHPFSSVLAVGINTVSKTASRVDTLVQLLVQDSALIFPSFRIRNC